MKKIIASTASLLLVLCFSLHSIAQQQAPKQGTPPPPPPKMTMEERMKHFQDEVVSKLNLTEDQKTKLTAAQKEFFTKMEEWRKAHPGQKPEKADVEAFIKERNDKVKSVLTADQLSKLIDLEKQMREKMKGQQGNPPPPQQQNQ